MRGDGHAGSVTGFALAVFAFFVAMVGTTLPAPNALRTPFAVDLGLVVVVVVVATAGLLLAPETVTRGAFSFRLQRLGVPAEVIGVFVRAGLAGVAAFAVSGVFSSVAPEFLGPSLHRHSPALAGLLVFVLFLFSIAGKALVRLPNALTAGFRRARAHEAISSRASKPRQHEARARPRSRPRGVPSPSERSASFASYRIRRSGGTSRY